MRAVVPDSFCALYGGVSGKRAESREECTGCHVCGLHQEGREG